MSHHVRSPNRVHSGWPISFEGPCISFAKLWPPECLVHVWAACFPLPPMWHRSVGCAMWGHPIGHVWVRSFRSRAPVLFLLGCDHPGALCTFGWPVCYFLPCGIIRSDATCGDMWGRPTGHVQVGPFHSRAPVSILLSCDHPSALCTFRWLVCHFFPCGIVDSGVLCRALWGRLTGRVPVGSIHSTVLVLVLLSCDHPGSLCMFGWPVFRLLPCGIVRSGTPCEVTRLGMFGSGRFVWGLLYQFC